jgi:ParB/RepB/Spo0J family partition protein
MPKKNTNNLNTRFSVEPDLNFDNTEVLGQMDLTSLDEFEEKPYLVNELREDMLVSFSPVQTRAEFDPKNNPVDARFVESIQENGVVAPIWAKLAHHPEYPNKLVYGLVAGHRRTAASRYLGLETIRAMVFPESYTQKQMDEFTFIENHHRKPLSPYELAKQISQIKETQKMSRNDLAKSLNISTGNVSNHLALLKAPKEILNLAKDEKISAATAIRIMNEVDASRVPAVAQAIVDGVGVKDAISLAQHKAIALPDNNSREAKESTSKRNKKGAIEELPLFSLLFADNKIKAEFKKEIGSSKDYKGMGPDARTAVALLGFSNNKNWKQGLRVFLGLTLLVQKRYM